MNFNKKAGFTLAEVLITLGIIGIVAALTVPTLMNNQAKSQYVTGLKKEYTTFNQALAQYLHDEGCDNDIKCLGVFDWSMTPDAFGDGIVKYFKVLKNCKETLGCFANVAHMSMDGSDGQLSLDMGGTYRFISADGAAYMIIAGTADCQDSFSSGATNNLQQSCGTVYIDVNGPGKGPNFVGRDIFKFYLSNGKGAILYPYGGQDVAGERWNDTSPTSVPYCDQGWPDASDCAGKVMEEGWQMNY